MERGLTGYLGLGSNVGDRLANLRAARDALGEHGVEVLAASSVYETAPQGEVTDQPDFLNACLRVRTALAPEELLDASKAVERELGRAPGGVRHGPRPIDVDVLLLGDLEFRSERLARFRIRRSRAGASCSSRCSSSTPIWRFPTARASRIGSTPCATSRCGRAGAL